MKKPPTCDEVARWPEFQAFAKRLCIDLRQAITKLTVVLDFSGDQHPGENFVKVEQEFFGGVREDRAPS